MNTDNLETFVEVARLGSFAAAARASDSDPSLVSRTIAGLERELGLRLFQRSTRRIALTEAGALYLRRAEAIVGDLARARDEALAVRPGPSGTLRITTSVTFGQTCLLPLLPAFRAAFPEVGLELLLNDGDIAAGRCRDLFPNHRFAATSFDTGAWLLYPSRSFLPHKLRVALDLLRPRLG